MLQSPAEKHLLVMQAICLKIKIKIKIKIIIIIIIRSSSSFLDRNFGAD